RELLRGACAEAAGGMAGIRWQGHVQGLSRSIIMALDSRNVVEHQAFSQFRIYISFEIIICFPEYALNEHLLQGRYLVD
ncbi:MAG TPA: hypothetical protein PK181_06820, partial [Methanothrix soehngenii]|nr:hypothetical protein [Methanothrix soehngenii]